MLSVVILSVVFLMGCWVIMLSATYAECSALFKCCTKRHHAKCRYTESRSAPFCVIQFFLKTCYIRFNGQGPLTLAQLSKTYPDRSKLVRLHDAIMLIYLK